MSITGYDRDIMTAASRDWRAMAETMTSTSSTLGGLSPIGLAPGVQGAATSFFAAWATHATESATLATGFADTLEAVAADLAATDDSAKTRFTGLDTRLGPAR